MEADESRRQERSIAAARVFVGLVGCLASVLAPSPGSWLSLLAIAYSATAAVWLLRCWREAPVNGALVLGAHVLDLGAATVATLGTAVGPSAFLAIWTFPLLAAAYRWGLRAALLTSAASFGLLASGTILASALHLPVSVPGSRLPVEASQLGVAAFLAGYLADRERQRRREIAGIARVSGALRLDLGLPDALGEMASAIGCLFSARRAVLIFTERRTRDTLLLDAALETAGPQPAVTIADADGDTLAPLQFEIGCDVWYAEAAASGSGRVRGLRWRGRGIVECGASLPRLFMDAYPCQRVIGVTLPIGDEWWGRVWLLDPQVGVIPDDAIRFARRLAQDVGPLVRLTALADAVRSRAEASERARLARELHDGVAQSLASADLLLEALHRRAVIQAPPLVTDLERIQVLVRGEAANLKALMTGMKEQDGDRCAVLLDELADTVARFARETGISARFVSDHRPIALSPRQSTEIRRILREGLVNVRKHSGARHVQVHAMVAGRYWQLSIGDDGRGFPFRGRLSQEELLARKLGPVVIGERVRALGGELTIESRPGQGARLDLLVPMQAT
jgi:signal transduction histidine kinase